MSRAMHILSRLGCRCEEQSTLASTNKRKEHATAGTLSHVVGGTRALVRPDFRLDTDAHRNLGSNYRYNALMTELNLRVAQLADARLAAPRAWFDYQGVRLVDVRRNAHCLSCCDAQRSVKETWYVRRLAREGKLHLRR